MSFTTEIYSAIYSLLTSDSNLTTILGHTPPGQKTIFRRVVPEEAKEKGTDYLAFRINSEVLPVRDTSRIRDLQVIFTLYCRNHTTICEASDRLLQIGDENLLLFQGALHIYDFRYDNFSSSAAWDNDLKRYVRDIRFRVRAKF